MIDVGMPPALSSWGPGAAASQTGVMSGLSPLDAASLAMLLPGFLARPARRSVHCGRDLPAAKISLAAISATRHPVLILT
jgi:hypothetical protein